MIKDRGSNSLIGKKCVLPDKKFTQSSMLLIEIKSRHIAFEIGLLLCACLLMPAVLCILHLFVDTFGWSHSHYLTENKRKCLEILHRTVNCHHGSSKREISF